MSKLPTSKNSLLYLAKFLRPYKFNLYLVFIALCFSSLSVLGIGYAIRMLIDSGLAASSPELLNHAIVVVITIITILSIASFGRSYLIDSICERVIADIRCAIYQKLIYVSPSFYELQKTSDIISRMTNDTTLIHSIIANIFSFFLRNSIMAIGGIVMMCITSLQLTFYVLAILPIIIIPIIFIGKKVRALSKLTQEKIGLISAQIEETLNGIKTVQTYTRESFEISKFKSVTTDALFTALTRIKLRSILVGLVIFMICAAITYVLFIGGKNVIVGKMSAGNLASFLFYATVAASAIGGVSEVATDLSKAAGAADRLCSLLLISNGKDVSLRGTRRAPWQSGSNLKNVITFANVNFAYPSRPEVRILHDLSFSVKTGAKIAIVGASGAGKSTIFQLLLRFYDYASGDIAIGNQSIKNLSLNDLRQNIALVTQEPVIFSASAYDNILYGNPDATLAQVKKSAKLAEIYDFLADLPQGLDSFLGEKGVRLSGGQKQRISIARAILKNPKILLLDEATNSLDSNSEALVQKALSKFMIGRTSIIIAHRLSTIIDADQILVLANGKIIETGTHAQLLKSSGAYSQLVRKYYDHRS